MIHVDTGYDGDHDVTTAEDLALLIRKAYETKEEWDYLELRVEGDPPQWIEFIWANLGNFDGVQKEQ